MDTLPLAARGEPPQTWTRQWPRCLLLLELTSRCAQNGKTTAGGRLLARIEEERRRMRGAPPLVETLLNELWYAATLVLQGDRTTAAHHAEEAREKAERVHDLLAAMRRAETRSHCASLRLRSEILQRKARELIQRSEVLLSRSYGIKERSTRDRQPLRC